MISIAQVKVLKFPIDFDALMIWYWSRKASGGARIITKWATIYSSQTQSSTDNITDLPSHLLTQYNNGLQIMDYKQSLIPNKSYIEQQHSHLLNVLIIKKFTTYLTVSSITQLTCTIFQCPSGWIVTIRVTTNSGSTIMISIPLNIMHIRKQIFSFGFDSLMKKQEIQGRIRLRRKEKRRFRRLQCLRKSRSFQIQKQERLSKDFWQATQMVDFQPKLSLMRVMMQMTREKSMAAMGIRTRESLGEDVDVKKKARQMKRRNPREMMSRKMLMDRNLMLPGGRVRIKELIPSPKNASSLYLIVNCFTFLKDWSFLRCSFLSCLDFFLPIRLLYETKAEDLPIRFSSERKADDSSFISSRLPLSSMFLEYIQLFLILSFSGLSRNDRLLASNSVNRLFSAGLSPSYTYTFLLLSPIILDPTLLSYECF